MSTIYPVMPPRPKLPFTPLESMMSLRKLAAARDAPPAPVWKEKPSSRSPECSMTLAA